MEKFVQEFTILYHKAPTLDVTVTAAVLRGGMQNYVRAESQRPLEDGAGERIVDDEWRASLVSDIRYGANVQNSHEGIRRRFHPNKLCIRADRCFERLCVAQVSGGALDAPRRQEVANQVSH